MRITYLKLQGFKRFPLRDTELFEHDFNNKLTMISGPNGSGKSSLFNQLTPLPADKSFFNENGYEEIHITYLNKNYELISDFRTKTPKYSFIVDGEELNIANIVTTQRDLVYMHFGITSDIHDILTGVESFSNMSLGARKKLFKTITHINIDDVLKNYNDLKEEHKVQTLLLKTQMSNYKLEESKLMEELEIEELKRKDIEYKEAIDKLLDFRANLLSRKYIEVDDTSYSKLKEKIDEYYSYIKRRYIELTVEDIKTIAEKKKKLEIDINIINSKLSDLYDQLDTNNKLYASLATTSNVNEEELLGTRKVAQERLQARLDMIKVIDDISNVTEKTKLQILNLESGLPDLLRSLVPNVDVLGGKIYTLDKYNQLLEIKNNQITKIDNIKQQELSLKALKSKSCETHGNALCPSCNHSWPLSEAILSGRNVDKELDNLAKHKESIYKDYANTEKSIEEIKDYFTTYKKIVAYKEATYQDLRFFWDKIDREDLIQTNPSEIIRMINVLALELTYITTIEEINRVITKIDEKLEELRKSKEHDLVSLKERIDSLTNVISNLQDTKSYLQYRLTIFNKAEEYHKKLKDLKSNLEFQKGQVQYHNLNVVLESIVSVVEDEIRSLRLKSVEVSSTIQQLNTIDATLKQYERDIQDTQSNIKVLDHILTELSPKNGLIAKSVSSFLNTIIHNVNSTINKIWSYKMVLVPIDVENDSLNYKFRVDIEDKLSIDDINKASKGMKECIDLAFKLVLYKLLKMDNYPLYLDELASHMDTEHSSNITNLVGSLAGSDRFSQLFIITHKENFGFLREIENIQLG